MGAAKTRIRWVTLVGPRPAKADVSTHTDRLTPAMYWYRGHGRDATRPQLGFANTPDQEPSKDINITVYSVNAINVKVLPITHIPPLSVVSQDY